MNVMYEGDNNNNNNNNNNSEKYTHCIGIGGGFIWFMYRNDCGCFPDRREVT